MSYTRIRGDIQTILLNTEHLADAMPNFDMRTVEKWRYCFGLARRDEPHPCSLQMTSPDRRY